MTYMFLAEGFEEIEALAVVDILRRGEVEIKTVSISANKWVKGSHGIKVEADLTCNEITSGGDCVILPGGMPGTTNLGASEIVKNTVMDAYNKGAIVAAICAAPSVFYDYGILAGKKATSYPDYEEYMKECIYTGNDVETDGNIVTSKGAGTAHLFGFKLLEMLTNKENSEKIKSAMQYR